MKIIYFNFLHSNLGYFLLNIYLVDCSITSKTFNFPKKYKMPFYFVSASDGTNVVKVSFSFASKSLLSLIFA